MKQCVYCGMELGDFENVCSRCGEIQSEHKSTEDLYQEAYDKFYRDFHKKIEGEASDCNAFETNTHHDKHDRVREELKREKRQQGTKEIKRKGFVWTIIKIIIVLSLFSKPVKFLINSDFVDNMIGTVEETSQQQEKEEILKQAIAHYYGYNDEKEPQYTVAYDLFEEVSDMKEAKYYMADILIRDLKDEGDMKSENLKKGKKLLEEASELGELKATFDLGLYYENGAYGFDKDINRALICFEEAAIDNSRAYYYMGNIYDNAQEYPELEGDKEKFRELAVKNFTKGSEAGDSYSQGELAYKYIYDYEEVGKSVDKGIELFKKAIDDDEGYAAYHLGVLYYQGKEVKKDSKEAKKYFEIAKNKEYKVEEIDKMLKELEKK